MKERMKREKRNHTISINCTESELGVVRGLFRQSTCRTISEYGRKLMMNKPVTVSYRNRSIDDLISAVNVRQRQIDQLLEHPSFGPGDRGQLIELVDEGNRIYSELSDVCIRQLKSPKAFTESSTTTNKK